MPDAVQIHVLDPEHLAALCRWAATNDQLVANFNRLTGCNFGKSLKRSKLDIMIDDATGAPIENDEDLKQFTAFVKEMIWDRLPAECFENVEAANV